MAGEGIVSLIKDAARNGIPLTERTDIVYGTVTSASPLKVKIENESSLELTETFLLLSPFCRETVVTIPAQQTATEAAHRHRYSDDNGTTISSRNTDPGTAHGHQYGPQTVTLWRGLQVGDTVLMLRCAQGNLFYILQRKEWP